MTARRTTPAADGSPLRELDGVVITRVGEKYGGLVLTAPFLRAVADNYGRLLESQDPHVDPPVVLGHEEDQADLRARIKDDAAFQAYAQQLDENDQFRRRTGAPAAGWPRNVTFNPETGELRGDFKGILPSIADLIDSGHYRFVSPKIYTDFRYKGRSYGPVLQHVGLLGATPPGDKSLAPLVPVAFAENPAGADAHGRYVLAFSETPIMPLSPEEKAAAVGRVKARLNLSDAFLAALSDDQLAELDAAKVIAASGAPPRKPAPDDDDTPTDPNDGDKPAPAPKPDDADDERAANKETPVALSEARIDAAIDRRLSEIAGKRIDKAIALAEHQAAARVTKRGKIDALFDRLKAKNHYRPAYEDATARCLRRKLEGFSDEATIALSEGAAPSKSQLDEAIEDAERLAELEAQALGLSEGDPLPQPAGGRMAEILDRAAEAGRNARPAAPAGKPLHERLNQLK